MTRRYLLVNILVVVLGLTLAMSTTGCHKKRETPGVPPELRENGNGAPEASDNQGNEGQELGDTGDRMKPIENGDIEKNLVPIYFDFDRSNIRPDQAERIEQNAQWLYENPEISVILEGHCDERGTVEYNFALGERRARAVRDYLVARGVDKERLATVSKGEEEPAVMGHTEEAYAKNRRVEFVPATK